MSIYNQDVAEYLETVGPKRRKQARIMGFQVTMTYEGQGTGDVWFEWDPHQPTGKDFPTPRHAQRFMDQYRRVRDNFMKEMMRLDYNDGTLVVLE